MFKDSCLKMVLTTTQTPQCTEIEDPTTVRTDPQLSPLLEQKSSMVSETLQERFNRVAPTLVAKGILGLVGYKLACSLFNATIETDILDTISKQATSLEKASSAKPAIVINLRDIDTFPNLMPIIASLPENIREAFHLYRIDFLYITEQDIQLLRRYLTKEFNTKQKKKLKRL